MPVSYDKLRKLLIDKEMKRTELKDAIGISFNVLATLWQQKSDSQYASDNSSNVNSLC